MVEPGYQTPLRIKQYNTVSGTLNSVTAVTSLLSTIIIALRIHYSTTHDVVINSRQRYRYIIEILVQSSVLYSLCVLAVAILDFIIDSASSSSSVLYTANSFINGLTIIVTVCLSSCSRAVPVGRLIDIRILGPCTYSNGCPCSTSITVEPRSVGWNACLRFTIPGVL